ncbi:MAG: trypsin-like peptidase domain-containing protein, partial [Terriglobales bacterium]
ARPAGPRSIAAAERRVGPAVVQINVETSRRRGRNLLGIPPGLAPSMPRYRVERSLGSGLILDPRGFIITNRHVIDRAQRIAVSVAGDNHTYYGRLVGADAETDLALVKIDVPRPLPAARLGDSARLAVGQWVVAIGSPFGLEDSVTAGIVSALNRAMDPNQQFENFIQTDAPINPGNSGGPLLDLAGDVVGINTAIDTYSDGYEGVGFALPSRLVEQVYRQLLRRGRVTRGSIGVYFESALDPAVRRVYHMEAGVPLSQVVEDGPAAKAGLRAGDLVTSLNGAAVSTSDALMNMVEFLPVGQTLEVGYERGGKAETVRVKVADRAQLYPDQAEVEPTAAPAPLPMPPDLGMQLKALPGGAGLRVQAVAPDSFADSMGVRRDDVVLEINHQAVHTQADLSRLADDVAAGADLAMVLRRPNGDGTESRWLVGGTVPPKANATPVASPAGKRR